MKLSPLNKCTWAKRSSCLALFLERQKKLERETKDYLRLTGQPSDLDIVVNFFHPPQVIFDAYNMG